MSDEFKDFIDGLFEKKKEEKAQAQDKKPTRKLSIPEPPKQSKEEQERAIQYAREELELMRQAFLDFSEKANHTVMYSYLYPHVQDFEEICRDLYSLIEDDVDKDLITTNGLDEYEKLRKIRRRLLSYVLDKYDKQGE